MKGKFVPQELRSKIIKSFVEDGIPVKQLTQEYDLNLNTYGNSRYTLAV